MEEERNIDALVDSVARRIVSLNVQLPAMVILEMYRPFFRIFRSGSEVLKPLAYLLVGKDFFTAFQMLIEDPRFVDKLLLRLEEG